MHLRGRQSLDERGELTESEADSAAGGSRGEGGGSEGEGGGGRGEGGGGKVDSRGCRGGALPLEDTPREKWPLTGAGDNRESVDK